MRPGFKPSCPLLLYTICYAMLSYTKLYYVIFCTCSILIFVTLLFRLLSLAQEGQGWLKEGTVALARHSKS